MRHKKVKKRSVTKDYLYASEDVQRFINYIMRDGKKTVAQKKFYASMDLLKEKGHEPMDVFEKALGNVSPKIEIRARRVGGANYQVPVEVRPERRSSLSIRWVIEAARKRSNKEFRSFEEKLAAELMAAYNNEGEAIRKKEIMHKQADANKAFAHFRW